MYLPAHFKEDRTAVLHDLIRAHPLATLVTLDDRGLVANHLPMEIDPEAGALGTLRGHVARGNPVWQAHRAGVEPEVEAEVEALVVFQGAQGYITPSYYPSKADTGKVVPTWNYATVHAHGPLRAIEDVGWLRRFVEQLTGRYEAARALATGEPPWAVGDAPAAYIDGMLKAIVGIEIPISRIEGKWKMSQNRSPEDRAGVVAGLTRTGDPMQRAIAELVGGDR
jgi:transcriptional regulator